MDDNLALVIAETSRLVVFQLIQEEDDAVWAHIIAAFTATPHPYCSTIEYKHYYFCLNDMSDARVIAFTW